MKNILFIIIILCLSSSLFAQKIIFNEDFETGKLSSYWTKENCEQKLQSDTVYKPYKVPSFSLSAKPNERCLVSHILNSDLIKKMILSDKITIKFAYYVTNGDYVSCNLHTNEGDYTKTFAPITPNTWTEVTINAKDFQSQNNKGDLTGKILNNISFSMFGDGEFIIDNISIQVEKSFYIDIDKNFIPIKGKDNFAKISITVYDEFGKPIKDKTKVNISCEGASFESDFLAKKGKVEAILHPTKTGIYNIVASLDKDTAEKTIVIVPGVENIAWDFPKNNIETDKVFSINTKPNSIIGFKGKCLNNEIKIKGNPYYLYIDGQQITGDTQNINNTCINTYNVDTNNHYFVLIPIEHNSEKIYISGVENITDLTYTTKSIYDLPNTFLTNLNGIKLTGIFENNQDNKDIKVTSLTTDDYFVLKGENCNLTSEISNNGTENITNIQVALVDKNKNIIDTKTIENLEVGKTTNIDFSIKLNELGYSSYYIIADYENKINETNKENNILPLLQNVLCYEEKKPTLEITNLKATNNNGQINITAQTNETGNGYITFKSNNALYYVYNFEIKDTNINENITIPKNIPSGEYKVELGIYSKASTNEISTNISIKNTEKPVKPMGYGTFIDMEKVPHFWYINYSNVLIWEGEPYIPFSYMFVGTNFVPQGNQAVPVSKYDGTLEELLVMQGVNSAGINNMENTGKVQAYMEEANMTYSTFAGVGNVIYWMKYPLQSFLVKNGKHFCDLNNGVCDFTFTDLRGEQVKTLYYMVYDLTDNTPVEINSVNSDKVHIEINSNPNHQYRAYFTADLTGGHAIHDYWSAWDDRISMAKEILDKTKFPKGVRYAIDPIENEEGFFFNNDPYKIPNCATYLKTFQEYLKNKYTIAELNTAWAIIKNPIEDYNLDLVPIQVIGNKSYVLNRANNKLIIMDATKSTYWYDTLDARDTSLQNLHEKYCKWFKEYCNVPIVSKRVGGHNKAFTCATEYGGFDGVGVDCYNLNKTINKVTGTFLADIEDSPRTCWMPTLEINYETPSTTKPTEGWPNETIMREDFARFLEMGVRGFNVFALDLRNTAGDVFAWPKFDAMLHPYQINWYTNIKKDLVNNMDKLANHKPKVAYLYPTLEPELNSFVYNDKSHYGLGWSSLQSKNGYWFIPTHNFNHNNLVVTSLPDFPISKIYGNKLNEAIDNCPILYIGLRHDLGQIPNLDKFFTNNYFTIENSYGKIEAQELICPEGWTVTHQENGKIYGIKNNNLQIVSMDIDPCLYIEKEDLPIIEREEINPYEILGVKDSTIKAEINPNDWTFDDKEWTYLSELTPTYAKQGWGVLETDHNLDMGPLGSKGIIFKHGLASHAPAEIIYDLQGQYSEFKTFIGLADIYVDMGTVTYDIYADGKNIFSSGLVKGSEYPRMVKLDIKGVNELKFIIGDGGDSNHADHACLFEARLIK